MEIVKYRKIKCESPVLLFDRSSIKHIVNYGGYYSDGVFHPMPHRCDRYFPYSRFSPFNLGLYRSSADKDGYFLDLDRASRIYTYNDDGIVPLFILVPCTKCSVCKYQKKQSLISRIQCESSCYPFPPLFVTLTYQKKFLPSDGVSRSDIVLFLKRLKYFLSSYGFNDKFSYYLNAEYGHSNVYRKSNGSFSRGTSRPHYHCIFFGIFCSKSSIKILEKAFQCAWSSDLRSKSLGSFKFGNKVLDSRSLGNVDLQFLRSSSSGAKYAAKYLTKKNCVPSGSNPLFTSCSRRPALGLRFLCRERLNFFRSHPDFHDYQIKNYDGSLFRFRFTPYFLRKIFPSYNQIIDSTFRKSLFKIESLCCELRSLSLDIPELNLYLYLFANFLSRQRLNYVSFYDPSLIPIRVPFYGEEEYFDVIVNDVLTECRSLFDYPSFEYADSSDELRSRFLDSLSEVDFDINLLSSSCRSDLRSDVFERLEETY